MKKFRDITPEGNQFQIFRAFKEIQILIIPVDSEHETKKKCHQYFNIWKYVLLQLIAFKINGI